MIMLTCEIQRLDIDVHSGDAQSVYLSQSPCEPARSTTHVENTFSRARGKQTDHEPILDFTNPAPTRCVVPGVVLGSFHGYANRRHAAINASAARSMSCTAVIQPVDSLMAPEARAASTPIAASTPLTAASSE